MEGLPAICGVLLVILWIRYRAVEPALVVVVAALGGYLSASWLPPEWVTSAFVGGVLCAMYHVSRTLLTFRGLRAPRNWAGLRMALAWTVVAGTWAAVHSFTRFLGMVAPAFVAAAIAGVGMRILLFRQDRAETPRLLGLLGGLFVFTHFAVTQAVLLLVLPLFLPQRRLQAAGRLIMRGAFYLFPYGRFDRIGCDPEAFARPAVVVSNHQSSVDIPIIAALPGDVRITVSARVWDSPWMGYAARRMRHVLVEPSDPDATLARCRERIAEGACVHFFPEGTRGHDNYPARFHRGAFELAVELGCDIIPVALCDMRYAVPRDAYWVERFHMAVRVLPRIPSAGRTSRDLMKQTQEVVRSAFVEELDRINTPKRLRRKVLRRYHYLDRRVHVEVPPDTPREGRLIIVGCGDATAAHWLVEQHPRLRVVAIEANADKARVARHSARGVARLQVVQAAWDAWEAPLADALWVRDAPAEAATYAERFLKPGGRRIGSALAPTA